MLPFINTKDNYCYTFKYQWQTTKYGLLVSLIVVFAITYFVVVPLYIAQPREITIFFILICIVATVLTVRDIYYAIKRVPEKIELTNEVLRGVFFNGMIVEIPLNKIDEINESKRIWILGQYCIRISSHSLNKNILVGRYLNDLSQLLLMISRSNPNCKVISKW